MKISYLLKFILLLPKYMVYVLSFTFHRNKKIWIFGSASGAFQDNAKYLYLAMIEEFTDNKCIWIANSDADITAVAKYGGLAYKRWSLYGLYYSLTGKYWFVNAYSNDINYYASGGAVIINLWHGIPYKKIEKDIDGGVLMNRYSSPSITDYLRYPWIYKKPDWMISPSDFVTEYAFTSAFSIEADRCLSFGNPRLALFDKPHDYICNFLVNKNCDDQIRIIDFAQSYEKTFIFMPTWRDANANFMSSMTNDLFKLNDVLKNNNFLLLLKCHPNTPNDALSLYESLSNVLIIDNKSDVYPLLPFTDGLITDYSSIMFDYVILDKPIYLYLFDYDEYVSGSRTSYFDLKEYAPGEVSLNVDELIKNLLSADNKSEIRSIIKNTFWKGNDSLDSSKLIFEFFKGL